ncbi:Rieske 2Fe-2S domain-containing protein [Actinospica durhamensis]|uniref:Cytochrome bc1 complex Rieske iron-sulfur subunit n=1 Tax=Actinospica durhamensis TaxID=1508375 RepID=A0A941EJN4_9ACTN|nr:Rieske (2Fe-2S) protein [Actinospica durhamensis]MBR7832787.1 Rieske 2Fe-2S domain-containing protein [Actinospica durhamensis]
MAEETKPAPTADRRTMLRATALGVAVAGVGVTAAACASSNSMAQGAGAQNVTAADTASAGSTLTTTAKVPVGGGFIDTDASVVVTQPESGTYKAFSSICTHQGCPVTSVTNNVIQCPCHGSQYSAKDGSVITGPATQALAAKNITVSGSDIILES